MKPIVITTAYLLITVAIFAQAPPSAPTLNGVVLKSEIGFTPLRLDEGKTPQTSPCATSPYTTDSKIYTVILKVLPRITGATEFKRVPNIWIDDANPKKIYLVTGNTGITQIKTSRRTYDAAFTNAAAEIVVPDLTWADASDILSDLQKSPRAVTNASLSLIPVTLPDNVGVNGLMQALADRGVRLHTKEGWAAGIQILQGNPSVVAGLVTSPSIQLSIPTTPGSVTTDLSESLRHLQGLVNALGVHAAIATNDDDAAKAAAPDPSIIFLVDSPCLAVALLPSVTGNKVSSGIIDFHGHYLFPFARGKSFAKVSVGGTSPLDRSADGATSTLTAALDAALNHDMNAAGMSGPIRFTGGLMASYERSDITNGTHVAKGSGGMKGSVSFPNFTQLTGNDTRPTLTFEAVGSTINGSTADTSQFEGNTKFKAKFRWTPIFNSSIDAAYSLSHDAIYGGRKNNYVINVDVLKFIVRDPLEFAATWRCGRSAPDFKRSCGFYTGFSLTSQQ